MTGKKPDDQKPETVGQEPGAYQASRPQVPRFPASSRPEGGYTEQDIQIAYLTADVGAIRDTMATTMATKTDIADLAGQSGAIRDTMATTMATKADIADMATKADVADLKLELKTDIFKLKIWMLTCFLSGIGTLVGLGAWAVRYLAGLS